MNASQWKTFLFSLASLAAAVAAASGSGFASLTKSSARVSPLRPQKHIYNDHTLTLSYQKEEFDELVEYTTRPMDGLLQQVVTLEDDDKIVSSLQTEWKDLPILDQKTTQSWSKATPMDIEVVHKSNMRSKALPLILQPTSIDKSSKEFLQSFLRENQAWVSQRIQEHGAVMFRGFDIETAQDVEDTVLSYNPNLNNVYRGTSPRNTIDQTKFVFSAAEVPSHWPIAQHLEMSFLPSLPRQVYFSALQAPKTAGGETALADFRKVYQDLPAPLRQKLETKKLRYHRTHHKHIDPNTKTHDVAALVSWPTLFGTTDKSRAEKLELEENASASVLWEGRDGNTFVSEFISEPFQLHPETGEMVWFNHAQVFHWTTFPAELLHAFRRTKDPRFLSHALAVGVKSFWKYGVRRRKMALHVEYGDGTRISAWEMHQIRKAIHNNMVFNRWEQGDLLFIDNFSTSHGRQPTYDSGRKIVVSWSDPLTKINA